MSKRKEKETRAYMIFTGVMIVCCLGLYLTQFFSATAIKTEAEPTPTPIYHSYPAEDVFFENAAAFGLAAKLEAVEGTLPGAAEYLLIREGMEDVHLTLSFKEGGVCAFLLRLPLAKAPDEPSKNATPIEQDLYEMALEDFAAEQAWRQGTLGALIAALDSTSSCTAADISHFCALLEENARKGTAQSEKAGEVTFKSYLIYQADKTFLCVSTNRRES